MRNLRIARSVVDEMVAHCRAEYPLEACGLLAGTTVGASVAHAQRCFPTRNAAASARVYEIDPRDHLRADREADAEGLEVLAAFHSHTHTPAYPSPTDVAQAPVPEWHYVLVSFQDEEPSVRSFRIADGAIDEDELTVVD